MTLRMSLCSSFQENFNVYFDNWFSESSLGDLSDKKSKISTAITSLKNKDLAYEDNGAIWLNTSHANRFGNT